MSDVWRGSRGEVLVRDPSSGATWRVREIDCPPDFPLPDVAAGRRHCLIFESEDAVRRVWDFPPTWRVLSAAELIALSWNR